MKKLIQKLKNSLHTMSQQVLDSEANKKISSLFIYILIGFVSVFMTVLNCLTDQGLLTIVTAVFAFLCILNFVLTVISPKGVKIASETFAIEILFLFTFFMVSGQPNGFSAIWICLLPLLGMLFYDRRRGSLLCLAMLVILVVLLWTPLGNNLLQYDYSYTFKTRFPILFCVFYVLAFFLETLRAFTQNELVKLNSLYKETSIHDQLTNIYNRKGFFEKLENTVSKINYDKIGVIIMDLDFFKAVNDNYGHSVGDEILKDFASLLIENLGSLVCRWGGEEFAIVYFNDDITEKDLYDFRETLKNHTFCYGDVSIRISVSIGVYETTDKNVQNFNEWMKNADFALYKAKNFGRDRIEYFGQ